MRAIAWIWSRISLLLGKIARSIPILDAKLAGRLALGGEVLGFGPVIHHLRSQKRDLAPNAFVGHVGRCADFSPSRRRRATQATSTAEKGWASATQS